MDKEDKKRFVIQVVVDIVTFLIIVIVAKDWAVRLWGEFTYMSMRDKYVHVSNSTPLTPVSVSDTDTDNEVNESENGNDNGNSVEVEYIVPQLEIDWDELQNKVNPDIYAWIYIPDTKINYAVLQHPTELDFYLEHNIDGTAGKPGCIYSQYVNGKEFNDSNTVLYGHNMKNGTMFKDLHKFKDKEFFDENKYIFIYTPDRVFVYKIFAAHKFDKTNHVTDVTYMSDLNPMTYISAIISSAKDYNYDESVTLNGLSRILTLSTCYDDNDYRWLVQGVLIN